MILTGARCYFSMMKKIKNEINYQNHVKLLLATYIQTRLLKEPSIPVKMSRFLFLI